MPDFNNRNIADKDNDDPSRDRIGALPDLSDLSILPDGKWDPVFRPLATGNGSNPWRGAEGHGTDNADAEFFPNEDGDVAPMMDSPGESQAADWEDIRFEGTPLFVTQVPHPLKSVTKSVVTRTVFDGSEIFSGSVGVVDMSTVQSIPRDASRDRVHVSVAVNTVGSAQFVFAMSHDGTFQKNAYIQLQSGDRFSIVTSEPLAFAIVPLAAYDPTKPNNLRLQLILESSTTIDRNSNRP